MNECVPTFLDKINNRQMQKTTVRGRSSVIREMELLFIFEVFEVN
jgi:hypothetical protein